MPGRNPLINSIFNGDRRSRDQTAPTNDEVVDDVRLLREISLRVEQEKFDGSFDATCPGEHMACLSAKKKKAARSDAVKRPAPKYNKALKEAENAALQKPLTLKRYRQIMKEHLEILPFVSKIMEKNISR